LEMMEAAPTGVLVVRDGNGNAIVDEDLVVGDEAGDFAAMFNGAVAVAVHDFNAEAGEWYPPGLPSLTLGEHLFVALGFEDGIAR